MDETKRPAGGHDNPEVEHETSDVSIRGILWFLGILAGGGLLIGIGLWWLMGLLIAREEAASPPPPPIAVREGLQFPRDLTSIPAPRLEAWEKRNLADLREYEERVLSTYGWADREAGVVRIPIDRARELVLQEKQLQSRSEDKDERGEMSP